MSLVAAKRGRPPSPQLHERRTEEILAPAARLFAERGFDGADTQELADRVGVGKGTLYRYFPSKQELFADAHIQAMFRPFRLENVLAPEPPESLVWQFQYALESRPLLFELKRIR